MEIKKGLTAKFFHPRTLGVMHLGTVVKVFPTGMVRVKFFIDGKKYSTLPDNNPA